MYGSARRDYRRELCPAEMQPFRLAVKETDLWLAVDQNIPVAAVAGELESFIWHQRTILEHYLKKDPLFCTTLDPHPALPDAPALAFAMARASNRAGVGPMAAVAGAFAQLAGEWLLRYSSQVIVENGGDIYYCCRQALRVGVYAGASPFSGRLAVEVHAPGQGRGICTSSATVGPSFSKGRADAAVICGVDALLADAVATAAASMVHTEDDLKRAINFALGIEGIEGALVILGDKLAVRGKMRLAKL
ncbi:MAG TPA: hypothetical protein DCQ14_03355 [Firmicutes bacterium]|nr:hypothetical protein [Bacillota bacterium]